MKALSVVTLVLLSATSAAADDIRSMLREVDSARIESTIRTLVGFGTRNSLSIQNDPKRGIGAARDWLFDELSKISKESGGRLTVEKQTWIQQPGPRVAAPTPMTNVIALLPGDSASQKDRIYIVSGHYDSMPTSPTDPTRDAPGANDDGSGTAAVLELARVMSKRHFAAPILFACVVGEEQGLLGSTHLAAYAKEQGWNVEAMFTNDIIGSTHGGNGVHEDRSVRVFSEGVPTSETTAEATTRRSVGGENDSTSRQLARFIKETGRKYLRGFRVDMIYRRDRYLRGGDHIPFNERGYAAVRFTEPNEDYTHQHQNVRMENGIQYGDLPEFVDFGYIANVARVNLAALAEIASAPASPKNVRVLTRRLSYDTELAWDADPAAAGYEVVWRNTDAPDWQHTLKVGKVATCVLKGISKDNYFFGVRALSKDGRRSPAVAPRPAR